MDDEALRYSRQVSLPQLGADGQRRLRNSTALLVGLGGLGATAAIYLGSSGTGRLLINDFDRVDITNLPRQILFDADDVGEYKTHAAAEKLRNWNPSLNINVLNRRLDDDELFDAAAGCGVVLDCTDNFAARSMINRACLRSHTPLISGAAIRFEGQLAVFRNDGNGPCYNCLYGEDDEHLGDCAGQGILAPVAGTIGCMMATEALKSLTGLGSDLAGRLWIYDGLAGSSHSVAIPRREECTACCTPAR